MKTYNVTLRADEVDSIREALLIGLTSYGEYVKARNAYELAELRGEPWPKEACPIDPTGCADAVAVFATALSELQIAESVALDADHAQQHSKPDRATAPAK